ncbi:MAG: nucleotidyl transferase AbiEii/AbiGii toxin family protein [Pseudonocardiaceae bacterium]
MPVQLCRPLRSQQAPYELAGSLGATDNDVDTVAALVRDVLAVEVDDGIVFDTAGLIARVIRSDERYAGVRIVVPARLDRARCQFRVNVNVGYPVTPAPVEIDFPALLAEPFRVVAYPIETVLAEKIVTMIDRATPPRASVISPMSCCSPGDPRSRPDRWRRRSPRRHRKSVHHRTKLRRYSLFVAETTGTGDLRAES